MSDSSITPEMPRSPEALAEGFANVGTMIDVDHSEDGQSDFSDACSDTTSLASSVMNYEYENGRRYHSRDRSTGKYLMPNDENEQSRLDFTHHIFLLTLQGELYKAPVKNPQKVLDLGTGTGIWAIDVADKFPEAHVIGNDISPIQPQWVPPNVEFVVDDFEREWMYPANSFDFIHSRTIAGCVEDWPQLIQKTFNHTKPGGYVEFDEGSIWAWSDDGSLKPDSPYVQYLEHLDNASKISGRELNVYHKLKQWMIDAGFEDVTESVYLVPLAPWAKDKKLKELGRYYAAMAQDAVEAYGLRLYTQVLGWDTTKAQVHHALVKNQLRDRAVHAYTKLYLVHGRKPTSA